MTPTMQAKAARLKIVALLMEIRPIVSDAVVEPGGVYQGHDLLTRLDALLDELEDA